jgi:hypothetical protein
MSLTESDLSQVRDVIVGAIEELMLPRFDEHDKRLDAIEADIRTLKEDVAILKTDMREVKDGLNRLGGRVEALEADVRELYNMVAAAPRSSESYKKLAKLPVEQKILKMYEDFQLLAKEAGVTLPR